MENARNTFATKQRASIETNERNEENDVIKSKKKVHIFCLWGYFPFTRFHIELHLCIQRNIYAMVKPKCAEQKVDHSTWWIRYLKIQSNAHSLSLSLFICDISTEHGNGGSLFEIHFYEKQLQLTRYMWTFCSHFACFFSHFFLPFALFSLSSKNCSHSHSTAICPCEWERF